MFFPYWGSGEACTLEIGTSDHFCDPVPLDWIKMEQGSKYPCFLGQVNRTGDVFLEIPGQTIFETSNLLPSYNPLSLCCMTPVFHSCPLPGRSRLPSDF
jgi:hypothetical protein